MLNPKCWALENISREGWTENRKEGKREKQRQGRRKTGSEGERERKSRRAQRGNGERKQLKEGGMKEGLEEHVYREQEGKERLQGGGQVIYSRKHCLYYF